MLRFAFVTSILGMAAAFAALVVNELAPIEDPKVLFAFFAAIFVTFWTAVWGHPKTIITESTVRRVSWWSVLKAAPRWSIALAVACVILMLAGSGAVPEGGFSVSSRADLVGHPERVRLWVTFCNVWYSLSLLIASSGLKANREFRERMNAP